MLPSYFKVMPEVGLLIGNLRARRARRVQHEGAARIALHGQRDRRGKIARAHDLRAGGVVSVQAHRRGHWLTPRLLSFGESASLSEAMIPASESESSLLIGTFPPPEPIVALTVPTESTSPVALVAS